MGIAEAQPLTGCEDTGITSFWLAKPLQEHFIERQMERRQGCSPRHLAAEVGAPHSKLQAWECPSPPALVIPPPHPLRHRARLLAFVIPHPMVPAKSLSCHNQAWSCRIQNNSGETSLRRGRGRKARPVLCKGAPAASPKLLN